MEQAGFEATTAAPPISTSRLPSVADVLGESVEWVTDNPVIRNDCNPHERGKKPPVCDDKPEHGWNPGGTGTQKDHEEFLPRSTRVCQWNSQKNWRIGSRSDS
jgi:hypothetical protein